MRQAFFDTIEKISSRYDNIYLLTGDLGFKLFDGFRKSFPERFFDVGVAEANMISMGAGLALSGKNVYCYSIIPFLTMRAYEQIRQDIAHHGLNVKLVGVGGGFTYGLEGISHYGIEDLSLMRSMPNMNVVVPASIEEAKQLAELSYDFPEPLYVRLGKKGESPVNISGSEFEIGKGSIVSEGDDIVIFAIGNMVYQAMVAAELLKNNNISATVVNMHTLSPLDSDLIRNYAESHRAVFTVEEHSIVGGLGSAVAEVISEASYEGTFQRIGIPEKMLNVIGHADFLRKQYGLTADGIVKKVLDKLGEVQVNKNERKIF